MFSIMKLSYKCPSAELSGWLNTLTGCGRVTCPDSKRRACMSSSFRTLPRPHTMLLLFLWLLLICVLYNKTVAVSLSAFQSFGGVFPKITEPRWEARDLYGLNEMCRRPLLQTSEAGVVLRSVTFHL